jgi:hypothetical protein
MTVIVTARRQRESHLKRADPRNGAALLGFDVREEDTGRRALATITGSF